MTLPIWKRELHEKPFEKDNKKLHSVCEGMFFIKNKNKYEKCKYFDTCPKRKMYPLVSKYYDKVKYRHVESFRKCQLYKNNYIDVPAMVMLATYQVIYANELFCGYMFDLKHFLNQDDKQTMKIYNAAYKRVKEYQKGFSTIISDKAEYFCDFSDKMDENITTYVEQFRVAVSLAIKDYNIPNSKEVAAIETVRMLLSHALNTIDKRIEEILPYEKDIVNLRSYEMKELTKILTNLSVWVTRKMKDEVINLDKTGCCLTVYQKFNERMSDYDLINKALEYAANNESD